MSFITVLAKEFAEKLISSSRLIGVKSKFPELNEVLKTDGFSVEEHFMPQQDCQRFINKIDSLIMSNSCNVWCDDTKADHRIYFANVIDKDFKDFYDNTKIREMLKASTGTVEPFGMLLAAKIEYIDGNLGSGGGWHRDSPITHQFKAVCYLNDVDETNGPFQYIKGSHRKSNVIRNYFNKVFKPGQYRFSDDEIARYLVKNNKTVESVTGKAGTLVYADTKGIHRGKPVERGTRYVLFCYFWHDKIPTHFESLKQNI